MPRGRSKKKNLPKDEAELLPAQHDTTLSSLETQHDDRHQSHQNPGVDVDFDTANTATVPVFSMQPELSSVSSQYDLSAAITTEQNLESPPGGVVITSDPRTKKDRRQKPPKLRRDRRALKKAVAEMREKEQVKLSQQTHQKLSQSNHQPSSTEDLANNQQNENTMINVHSLTERFNLLDFSNHEDPGTRTKSSVDQMNTIVGESSKTDTRPNPKRKRAHGKQNQHLHTGLNPQNDIKVNAALQTVIIDQQARQYSTNRRTAWGKDPLVPSERPTPTPTYLSQTLLPAQRVSVAQPLLVISDLNGTLLFRKPNRSSKNNTPSKRSYKPRPGLDTFLSYLLNTHTTMIWTSARPHNANHILSSILGPPNPTTPYPVAVWARDTLGLTQEQYSGKTKVYKKLETVWNNEAIRRNHPHYNNFANNGVPLDQTTLWGQHNTLLIDDSVDKGCAQPFNLVNVPELTQESLREEEAEDAERGASATVLAQVMGYIEAARWHADVSCFVRASPFRVGEGWEKYAPLLSAREM